MYITVTESFVFVWDLWPCMHYCFSWHDVESWQHRFEIKRRWDERLTRGSCCCVYGQNGYSRCYLRFKLWPATFLLSKHVIHFHKLPAQTVQFILQHGFQGWLEFRWHNDLETCHLWIWITSVCGLVYSDFMNDKFLGYYTILIAGAEWFPRGGEVGSWFAKIVSDLNLNTQLKYSISSIITPPPILPIPIQCCVFFSFKKVQFSLYIMLDSLSLFSYCFEFNDPMVIAS